MNNEFQFAQLLTEYYAEFGILVNSGYSRDMAKKILVRAEVVVRNAVLAETGARCWYADCVAQNRLAENGKQLTCNICRQSLGFDPISDLSVE